MLSILSGILMVVSFPYTGSLTFLVFISWVPLLLVEQYISMKRYSSRKVFVHAYLTFLIYNVGTTWWVWNASAGGSVMAFVVNSLLMSLTFYAFHLTKKYVGNKEGYISLLIYWISFEYMHYHWEASWTWLTLGNTFSIIPSWVQWYAYTGVLGGSLWILIINLLVFRIFQNVWFRKESWKIQTPLVWLASFFLLLPMCISFITYFTYTEKKDPVEIVAIQPNIDPYNEKFVSGSYEAQLQKIIALAKEKTTENTALVLAPETAISVTFHEDQLESLPLYSYLLAFQREMHQVPICIGATTKRFFPKKNSRASFKLQSGPGYMEFYNSSVFINESGNPSYIHKSKLVPGVEAIPFSDHFPFLEEWSIDLEGTSGTLGVEPYPKNFKTRHFSFAPVVCYESIYGEWIAEQCKSGAQIICIATNDGWWEDTPGYKQHMSFARLRAIENRRSIARSANTGTSAFINQRGDVLQSTEWWVPDVIRASLNLNSEPTFYTTYGDVIGRSFSFVTWLLLIYTFVRRFKRYYEK